MSDGRDDQYPRLVVDKRRLALLEVLAALVERDLGASIYRGVPLSAELLEAIEILRKAGWGNGQHED